MPAVTTMDTRRPDLANATARFGISAPMLWDTDAETACPIPQQGSPAMVLILRPTPEAAAMVGP